MKNTRTVQRPIRKLLKGAGSAILLATLFVLVFAGTLSGAFGIENSLQESGIIESNVADATTWHWQKNSNNGSTILNYELDGNISSYMSDEAYDSRGYSYIQYFTDGQSDANGARVKSDGTKAEVYIYWTITFSDSMYHAIANGAMSKIEFKINSYSPYTVDNRRWRIYGDSDYSTEIQDKADENTGNTRNINQSVTVSSKLGNAEKNSSDKTFKYYARFDIWSSGTHTVDTYIHNLWVDMYRSDNTPPTIEHTNGSTEFTFNDATAGIYKVYASRNGGEEQEIVFDDDHITTDTKTATWTADKGGVYKFRVIDNVGNVLKEKYEYVQKYGTKTSSPFELTCRDDFNTLSYAINGFGGGTWVSDSFSGSIFNVVPDTSISGQGSAKYGLAAGEYINMLGTAFTPIADYGTNTSLKFQGTINGKGCTLVDFVVNTTAARNGLVGTLSGSGKIQNLNIGTSNSSENSSITSTKSDSGAFVGFLNSANASVENCVNYASISGGYQNGGIVANIGNNGGKIINCRNYGSVSGSYYIGGIVGIVQGANGETNSCTNSGNISGAGNGIGGIVGHADAGKLNGEITNTGEINSSGGEHIGGIVGFAQNVNFGGTIKNEGNVTATNSQRVGGIVGYMKGGTLTNAVNSGAVTGNNDVGGIVGVLESIVENDRVKQAAIINNATNSGDISAGTLLKTSTNNNAGGIFGWVVNDVKIFGKFVNNGNVIGNANIGGIVGYNTGNVGYDSENNLNGEFIVKDCTISGKESVGGIVGFNDTNGKIGISSFDNSGTEVTGSQYIGGVLGYCIGAFSITTSTDDTLAPTNKATVKATSNFAGGFIGYVKYDNLTLSNLTNNGTINGSQSESYYVGGIIGGLAATTTITSGINSGAISGTGFVGGIVGGIDANTAADLTITNSHNSGDITSTSNNVGGILGGMGVQANVLTITGSYNSGAITCTGEGGNVGGIVGRIYTTRTYTTEEGTKKSVYIANCYNLGSISEKNDAGDLLGDSIGGIVGYLYAADTDRALVEYCYNYAKVEGKELVGGIIGSGASGSSLTISYCYVVIVKDTANPNNSKDILSNSTCGAIIGGSYNGTVVSDFKVENSWGFLALGADNQKFNDLGKVLFTDLTVTPQFKENNVWTDVAWTDILTKNINGFKVTGTTAAGKYASSIWGDSAKSSAGYDYTNVATPSSIEVNSTANGTGDAQTNCAIEFTFYYDASAFEGKVGVRVEVKDISPTANQTKEYNSQKQVITNPTTPQITDESDKYGIIVVYFDDAAHTQNLTTDGKTNVGTYYYIADITLGGKVVGRYLATFEITPYDFANKTFNEDYWFGANDKVIVTNQKATSIKDENGNKIADLFLLNSDASDRPQALIYQGAAGYKEENFVLYIKYTIIDKNGETSTVILPCNEFEVTEFLEALNEGEHVREATEISIQGIDGNVQGTITRYYTLLDSDFGWTSSDNTKEWGTQDNPYIISTQAQLMRLSQILNGDKAWNSINNENPDIVLAPDARAVATDKTYAGACFVVTANINLDGTFKPIGNGSLPFKAASFASGGTLVEISYYYNSDNPDNSVDYESRNYVGLFGNVEGTHFKDLLVRGASYDGTSYTGKRIVGLNYVGGLVGYMQGGVIENCTFTSNYSQGGDSYCIVGENYVGGLVGYASGTQVLYDTSDSNSNMGSKDNLVNARVSGTNYVGGIIGKWEITSASQFNNNGTINEDGTEKGKDLYFSAVSNIIVYSTGSYAGAIAGELDASKCTNSFNLNARLYYISTMDKPYEKAQVVGTNYVGALYGSFIGNGTDSTTLTYGKDYLHATVNFASAESSVVGGIVGYLQDATLAFAHNYTVDGKAIVFGNARGVVASKPSFFGGIIGVLGKGANISNGAAISDGNKPSITLKNAVDFGTSANPYGDFVGGIIGYVSSGAGRSNMGSTIFGDDLIFVNSGAIHAHSYVGGIFGAIGIIDGYTDIGDFEGNDIIVNNLENGSTTTTQNENIVTFKPASAQNVADVSGVKYADKDASYIGGIVGGVFKKALAYFVNSVIDSVGDNQTYEIYNKSEVVGDTRIGGIVGYLDQESHMLIRIVNIGKVGKADASYVGGLVGYMVGGTIQNSVSAVATTIDEKSNHYIGSQYVGGLVGYMQGGTLENSISTGFKFDNNTSITKGGVVGNVLSANIEGSWTIYIATNPTYSTTSLNKNGKYILVDSGILSEVGTYAYILAMAGICEESTYNDYTFKQGELLLGVGYPTKTDLGNELNTTAQPMQLAFYDVSGSDSVMTTPTTVFTGANGIVRIGVSMADGASYSICVCDVLFKDIAKFTKEITDQAQLEKEQKENAQEGYRAPSGANKSYRAEVTTALYDDDGNITRIIANIYFKDVLVGSVEDVREGIVGGYDSGTLEPGKTEATPLTISTQEEWNEFAWNIYSGTNTYTNAHIKLLTDVTVTKSASHTGINNATYTFGSLTTNTGVGAYATDNVGYNFAGSIANSNTGSKSFQGNFDGNGHKIKITYDSGNYHNVSVFPNAKGASFKNLTIEGYIVAGDKSSENKVITSSGVYEYAKLEYNAARDIAGFVGKPLGSIRFENCINHTSVIGYSRVAGFAGFSTAEAPVTFIGCVNKGNIESLEGSKFTKNTLTLQEVGVPDDYEYGTGGLIAYATNNITIESCLNTGKIEGKTKVGGLVGRVTAVTTINNSANTGEIIAQEYNLFIEKNSDGTESDNYKKKRATNAWSRVGGIVGEAGEHSTLKMYACYNTGQIRGWSNIAGGLVGIIGTIPDDKKSTSAKADNMATIVYSYNTGKITVGYLPNCGIPQFGTSGYNFNGSLAGGIVGVAVQLTMRYCYNTGDIDAYGGNSTRALSEWQSRNGGILAEAATESGVTHEVKIENCYSVGEIRIMEANKASSETHYSADIVGFVNEDNIDNAKVTVNNCYGIANNIINQKDNKDAYYSGWNNQDGGSIEKVRTGTTLANLAQLTAVMKNNSSLSVGTIQSLASTWDASATTIGAQTDANYQTGSLKGYIYMPGCLPQLAVFAVDTYNGLSMNSQNYGYDDNYGGYKSQNAGDKYSPYVIRDGIDLLGLQALVDLGFTFDGKYVEFANGTNNITLDDKMASDTALIINMPTDGTSDSPSATAAYKFSSKSSPSFTTASDWKTGKSYHLFALGGVLKQDNTSTNTYDTWKAANHAYKSSNTAQSGASFADQNFIPIGRKGGNNIFKGNISGAQQADGKNTEIANTEIANLRITYIKVAGLFGNVQDASITNITVSGTIKSHATSNIIGGTSYAGGIVAAAYGSTIISGCKAGSDSTALSVSAYAMNDSYSDNNVKNIETAAGGIVGIVNTARYSGSEYSYTEGTASTVRGNITVNASVASVKNNIGGTVGLASGKVPSENAKDKNNRIDIESNKVLKANIGALSASGCTVSDVGTKTGGILGYADEYLSVIVRECVVGDNNANDSVVIIGENRIGGIVGEMPDAAGEIVGCKVYKSATIKRASNWGTVTNADKSGTAIGGIVGLTFNADGTDPITTTFSGNIVFQGKIVVGVQTNYISASDRSNDGVVRNVGGIVGDMGAGARIATGSEITVRGTIEISAPTNENHANRNIGGVAGRTDDVAFSGKFDVAPTITATSAYQIGGFIGKNIGTVNILADDTNISIGGNISASHDVGGFIGYNAEGSTLLIGADQYRAVNYNGALSITIVQSVTDAEKKADINTLISASDDNVGGIVGNSAQNGFVQIVKGTIVNKGQVKGNDNVGGIIGINDGNFSTGGSVYGGATLEIVNEGKVTGNDYIGGVIGKLNVGEIAGRFVNKGNVSGRDYVGGSIGFVSKDASIKSTGAGKTEFVNEAVAIATTSDALVSSDATVADDSKFNVSGRYYVGGSIGLLFGSSLGNENYKVEFRSKGTVNGEKYVGGSIGVLAGITEYTDFISDGEMSGIGATTAVGGSVGFIGVPNPLINEMKDADIRVTHTHFEANGTLTLNATTHTPSAEEEYVWGGIGGAIGAIGNAADNLFDNSDGTRWVDNTYYASGNVSAAGFYHVGGIVGLIKADNITIANMLAYDTVVTGAKNVGGIVGATIGKKTVIKSAFSISTNIDGGVFTATDGNAGGIIGLARVADTSTDTSNGYDADDDTDASSSYWVKGYSNAELASSNVEKLQTTLGRYTLVYETWTDDDGQTITVIFTKELIGSGSKATTSAEGDETGDTGDTGDDSDDEEVAIYPTPYDYYAAVGTHTIAVKVGENTTKNVTYTINADEIPEDNTDNKFVLIDENWTWEQYFESTKPGENVEYVADANAWVVKVENWKQYSTGTKQTGWYFVYANDQGIQDSIGTISAVHSENISDDETYWKRIADAYTREERTNGDDKKKLESLIVRDSSKDASVVVGGGEPQKGMLYATATSADFATKAAASGYYMYIASSGDEKPTAKHGTTENEDKFFIRVETVSDAGIAENVAVYYRSIAMGSALTYNGYARYAPISLQKDITYDTSIKDGETNLANQNKYFYNTTNKENQTKDVGTYHSTVNIYYYDDLGTAYTVGGIKDGTWRINKRKLTFTQTGMDTNYIYGESYSSDTGDGEKGGIRTTLTVGNIVTPDTGTFDFEVTITDASGKELAKITWDADRNPNVSITDNAAQITVSGSYQTEIKNNKAASDKKYTVDNLSDGKAYAMTFVVTYKMAKTYKVQVSNISDSKNYQIDNKEYTLTVERRGLTLSLNPTSAQFDNNTHTATWTIQGTGGKDGILSTDSVYTVLSQFTPKVYAKLGDADKGDIVVPYPLDWTNVYDDKNSAIEIKDSSNVVIAKFEVEGNTIKVSMAKNVGTYYIEFGAPRDNCNYKFGSNDSTSYTSPVFKISNNTLQVKWTTDKPAGRHTYDAQTHGKMIATIKATYAINDYENFILAYFNQYKDGNKLVDAAKVKATVSGQTATIVFTTSSFEYGTYSAGLGYSGSVQEVNCRVEYENGTTKDGVNTISYNIDRAKITLSFEGMDGANVLGTYPKYTYNTKQQGLSAIVVNGLYSTDASNVYLSVSGVTASPSSGKLTNGKLSVTLANNNFIDANTYDVSVSLKTTSGKTRNYVLSGSTRTSWTISPKELTISGLTGGKVDYDATAHYPTIDMTGSGITGTATTGVFTYGRDTIVVNYSINGSNAGVFVNAGQYDIKVADTNTITATRNGSAVPQGNYKVINNSNNEVTFTINAAKVEIIWNEYDLTKPFVYNKTAQGLTIASLKFTANGSSVTKNISNGKFAGYGNDKLTVAIEGKKTNAGKGYKMEYSSHSLDSNTFNSGIAPIKENYSFTGGLESGEFNIDQSALSITHSGGSITKVYDATTTVPQDQLNGLSYTVTSTNGGDRTVGSTAFTVTATYSNENVGTGIGIVLEYSLKATYNSNYSYAGGSQQEVAIGTITPATITVTLDRLRNGRATRTFAEDKNGNISVYYGGANGAVNGQRSNRSQTYRLGEGFTIDGFPSAEADGVVRVLAKYVEVGENRSAFNGYVNYIYDSGNGSFVKDTATSDYVKANNLFKALEFSIEDVVKDSGKSANYRFHVVDSSKATISGDEDAQLGTKDNPVRVYDSADTKNKNVGNQTLTIEITVKTYKIKYDHTTQSYANADGTYNTKWEPVEAVDLPSGIEVTVENGWMTENGAPKIYKEYTVIRGSQGSKELSASVSGQKGKQLNYNMTNQPVLTIGYFVETSGDVFEIGSLSSLMIASYYWWVSANSGNPEFNQVINTTVTWHTIVSNTDYEAGTFTKPDDAPEGVTTWDAYFEWLETEKKITVFLNETGDDDEIGNWGYYTVTSSGESKSYAKFKQIKDINGTFTDADIAMLDSFFQIYDIETGVLQKEEWGKGGKFITNFLKVGAGNVAVAIGSIFKSLDTGFTGTYDGGGYVIEYFNIMNFDDAQNTGMFDVLGITASVKNVHLRNFTVTANGGNVGGIAGKALAGENAIENVSWHGTISMSGNGNVGGIVGLSARSIDKAIALGTINAKGGNIGGLIGSIEKDTNVTIINAVSFVYIDAQGNVGAIAGNATGASVDNIFYLASSAWTRKDGALTVSDGTLGIAKTYTQLIVGESVEGVVKAGSLSGYIEDADGKKYYQGSQKGVYDMLDDFDLAGNANRTSMNARQSLRLKDIIDVYMLMYSVKEIDVKVNAKDTATSKVYTISATSWLVNDKHGTDTDKDEIVISNRQQVALLRELRFASFILDADVVATATSGTSYAYGGAFFGKVTVTSGKAYTIDFGSNKSAFEKYASGSSVPSKQNA